jgi:4-azaleucine resistance transporter AzlC
VQQPLSRRTYLDGVRKAAPIGVAAFAFGLSFGVLARSAGMGRVAPVVMSVTTFAGSAQFAVASILGAGGGLVTAIVAAILLNLRYGPIGLSAAGALEGPWWKRALTAQLVVDESWAIAQRDDGRIDRHLLVGAGLLLLVCWTIGTAIGAFAGDLVADPEALGLDAAFPALFLALLWSQVRERSRLLAALGGAAIALVLMPFTGPGIPIVAASLACLVGARNGARRPS